MTQHKQVIDGALAGAGLSSPFWLHWLQTGTQVFFLLGGAVLLAARLYIAFLEIREKRRGKG